ncbi:MAG: lipopolysaccharide transport periplasmic protein LptA [Chromatiaceae bacterium]|nr:lipopolysaccharide transport periplasmic protein LptA [Gammaproteobacteria bacterium]MCP5427394.1 lipopolysaccharide transport periplasmic protein LptA [Chromatiaceae bacterium]MCB1860455.1 lipopolysaccharide transport periplasmic protein LptA [Gammaproteobacteria bacterium]MCB1871197.1 lipopolysaccharide transport periplasmic protein LptA [Gammaproteobacteria bacterium]MCB1879666.1 lipopolysaccharide transport periplasmic protein LptA [Gammaproteobacteria bacterium]
MKLNSFQSHCRTLRLACCLALILPIQVSALESDSEQPIYVEADGADINDKTGVSVYTGNVVVTQGSIKLNASKVTVTQKGEKSDHILAEGNPVEFEQKTSDKGLIKGRANTADYHIDSEIVYMVGDAIMIQGKDTFRSDRITYDRVKGQVKAGASAKGQQRVRIAVQPKKKTDK